MGRRTTHASLALAVFLTLASGGIAYAQGPCQGGWGASLSWNALCCQPGAAVGTEFPCSDGTGQRLLHVMFVPYEDFSQFLALDAVLDIGPYLSSPPYPRMPSFWHFERGGCNEGGIKASVLMPADAGSTVTPWEADGSAVQSVSLAYGPDYPSNGIGRVAVSIARSEADPFPLVRQGVAYFGFTIRFSMCAGELCAGCSEPMGVLVRSLVLTSQDGTTQDLGGSGALCGSFVCMNQGFDGCPVTMVAGAEPVRSGNALPPTLAVIQRGTVGATSVCEPVSVLGRTWGSLKILYR